MDRQDWKDEENRAETYAAIAAEKVCKSCGGSRSKMAGCLACCRDCGFPCNEEKDAEAFHVLYEDDDSDDDEDEMLHERAHAGKSDHDVCDRGALRALVSEAAGKLACCLEPLDQAPRGGCDCFTCDWSRRAAHALGEV